MKCSGSERKRRKIAAFILFLKYILDDADETTSTDQVYKNVISGVKDRSTSIVLQHDTKSYSIAAVEKIIQWGLDNGYTFLPLDMTSPTAHHRVNN